MKTSSQTNKTTSRGRHHNAVVTLIAAAVFAATTSCVRSLPVQDRETTIADQDDELERGSIFQLSPLNSNKSNPFAPRSISYVFDSKQLSPYMQMRKLPATSNNITCNDGSPVGYYLRQNVHSKSWVIYLQGGGFCGSEESCLQRWQRSPHLMSSNYWPKTKSVDGILSNEPKQNPYLWNANHVYIPYCSSDSWTGLRRQASLGHLNNHLHHSTRDHSQDDTYQTHHSTSSKPSPSSLNFLGSAIIERVLKSLYDDFNRESSLHDAKFILLAGESAGATGVIMNLDKVKRFVDKKFEADKLANCSRVNETIDASLNYTNCDQTNRQQPVVRGLADSGWFLDNEPYDQGTKMFGDIYFDASGSISDSSSDQIGIGDDCDRQRCGPLQSIKQAMRFWNGQVPSACAANHPLEPWRCYFGYRAYQTLKTPLFIVQWLYDEAQLLADNLMRPITSGQWDYVNKLVADLRVSFENVTALFAPSCFSHGLVTKPTWNQININGLKLPHVLNSWEEQSLVSPSQDQLLSVQHSETQLMADEFSIVMTQSSTSTADTRQNNISNFGNRPNFEAILVEQTDSMPSSPGGTYNQMQQDQPSIERTLRQASGAQGSQNRHQKGTRKRKRNNTNNVTQQNRNKQLRQRSTSGETLATSGHKIHNINDPAQGVSSTQNLSPLIDKSVTSGDLILGRVTRSDRTSEANTAGRLGRSTIVEESTLLQSNNVPDDIMTSASFASNNPYQHRQDQQVAQWQSTAFLESASKFRLIDSCGWPQCNRDCPTFNADMGFS